MNSKSEPKRDYSKEFHALSEDFYCTISRQGTLSQLSSAWKLYFGDNLEGGSHEILFQDLIHFEDQNLLTQALIESQDSRQRSVFKLRMRNSSGNFEEFQWRVLYCPEDQLWVGIGRNIHAQKAIERQLLESNQKLNYVIDSSFDGFWDWHVKSDYEYMSPRFWAIFGYEADEKKHHPSEWMQIIHPEDLPVVLKSFEEHVASGGIIPFSSEVRYKHKQGHEVWILCRGKVVEWSADGSPQRVVGTHKDITERKKKDRDLQQAHKNLQDLKTRLEIAVQAVHFGVWEFDAANDLMHWDDQMFRLFDLKKDEFSGKFSDFLKTLVPEDATQVAHLFGKIQNEKKGRCQTEFRIRNKQGEVRIIQSAAQCLFDSNGVLTRVVGVNSDVTEQRRSELKLLQSSKMASLGEMAGGVAHEINNPLAVIKARSDLLLKMVDSGEMDLDKMKKGLGKIHETVGRIARIVKGLKSFSRDSSRDPKESVVVSRIVEESVDLCREKMKNHGIHLEITGLLEAGVYCQPVQVGQVLLNLLNNAYDAVLDLNEKWIRIQVEQTEGRVQISVLDSGPSIPAEVAEKMMQPFFTTKGVGKGTGLGLSISKGLIEGQGGKFYFDPSDRHTRFVVELPQVTF